MKVKNVTIGIKSIEEVLDNAKNVMEAVAGCGEEFQGA